LAIPDPGSAVRSNAARAPESPDGDRHRRVTIACVQRSADTAIANLIYTYAERMDAGDFAGVADLFARATLTFEGFDNAVSGRDAIEALYLRSTRRYEDGTPRTKHVMTNVIVEVADDGETARSRSYFTVLQAVPGAISLQPVVAGRYRHSYVQAEGQWHVTGMHITIDLTGDLTHHMLFDLAP
jgi:ketosteroid isomerase-like protein